MSGLLPSAPDVTPDREPEPRVIGLESDDASNLLSALSAETTRSVLTALHEEPATASGVADRVETSIQNAQYHLEKLEEAELIEEVDTCYSEKGREMSVYAPTNGPLVVFPGGQEDAGGLERLLKQAFGAIAVLAGASLLLEGIVREWIPGLEREPADEPAVGLMEDGAGTPEEETAHWLVEAVSSAPPGGLVFLGGILVVLLVLGVAVWQQKR